MSERQWLNPKEAAAYLGVSRRTLLRLDLRPARLGHKTVRYDKRDLDAFMEQRKDAA